MYDVWSTALGSFEGVEETTQKAKTAEYMQLGNGVNWDFPSTNQSCGFHH